jgi:hypothetical protein
MYLAYTIGRYENIHHSIFWYQNLSEKRVLIKNSDRMRKIEAIIRSEKSEEIIERLRQTGIDFLSLTVVPLNDSEQIYRQHNQQGLIWEYQKIQSGYSFPPISYRKRNIC